MKGYKAETLTPRLGKPEDIAELVAFLASDAAGYITGQTIRAEGGLAVHSPVVSYYE
jgi:NAD(P)-dependent dehydrogenase (short-subunit alcohol dehydrogenase family)